MLNSDDQNVEWQHPKHVLKLQKLKIKKQALQARIKNETAPKLPHQQQKLSFEGVFSSRKRQNPFVSRCENVGKKPKTVEDVLLSESTDCTLFTLLNSKPKAQDVSAPSSNEVVEPTESDTKNKLSTSKWCPIDWTLKRKLRLISPAPFPWTQTLKISEESSGITSFTRCLDMSQCADSSLDVSPNAQFHQCCLYWQQPVLPWLTLFPRNSVQKSGQFKFSQDIRQSLYDSWTDSLKSLYQLVRTRQCPYFYVCANQFTVLFRAAGMSGRSDLHVLVTPTTRGLRQLLKEEDIEFEMPLKVRTPSDDPQKEDEDSAEEWLNDLGVNEDDIKSINYTQGQIKSKLECHVDRTDQSLVLVEGVEVNSFFNFLLNCKSAIATTGPLAGVPPTLLAPVSFYGATLQGLKMRQNRMHSDGVDFHTIELSGPILPKTPHQIFTINRTDLSLTMSFTDIDSTRSFSRVLKKCDTAESSTCIFGKENLSDCGLHSKILTHFCSDNQEIVHNLESLKYCSTLKQYQWT